MSFRFLHSADWQIGKPFARYGQTGALLRAARLDAIDRLAQAARQRGAFHVLVAGDVYDTETPDALTRRGPVERMRRHSDLHFWLMPGNHDPHRPGGLWQKLATDGLPSNVHLMLEAAPVTIAPNVVVLPAPLTTKHETRDLTAWWDKAATALGVVRIGLAHGGVREFRSEGESPNKIDPERKASAGLAYLGLGDWHRTQEVRPGLWYAGTPEPDRHNSQTEGAALLVELHQDGTLSGVERLLTGYHQWAEQILPVTDLQSLQDGIDQLVDRLGPRHVVRLRVEGMLDFAGHQVLEDALERLGAHVTHLEASRDDLAVRPSQDELEAVDFDGILRSVADDLLAEDTPLAQAALLRLWTLTQGPDRQPPVGSRS
jgi:DNA repair exonuclease SbcCD nuclease subunit